MLRIFMVVYNELSTLLPDSYNDAAKNKKNEIYRGNERYSFCMFFIEEKLSWSGKSWIWNYFASMDHKSNAFCVILFFHGGRFFVSFFRGLVLKWILYGKMQIFIGNVVAYVKNMIMEKNFISGIKILIYKLFMKKYREKIVCGIFMKCLFDRLLMLLILLKLHFD